MEPEDNIKICRVTRKILEYSLMWPRKKYELTSGNWNYIKMSFVFLIICPWCSGLVMHLILAFKNDLNKSEDVALTCCFCGLSYSIFSFVKNQTKIAFLLRDLSDFQKFGKPPGFENLDKNLNYGSLGVFLYAFFGLAAYALANIMNRSECEEISIRKGIEEICGLPTPSWIPVDVNYFPLYQLICFYILVCMELFIKSSLIISYMLLEITHHIVLRIKHLEQMIFECLENKEESRRKKFTKCILYHREIIEFARRTNVCFSDHMFAHLSMTAAICGCLEKQFIDGQCRVCALIHNLGWIMALFVACYGGQHLVSASASFTDAIWSSTWYQADLNLKKDIMFMLLRSQKINYVRAGPFSEVSFPLFLSVMKMSYSILCVVKS